MFLFYYDDEPEQEPKPERESTVMIWLHCLRWAIRWTAFYALLAAVVVLLGAIGYL